MPEVLGRESSEEPNFCPCLKDACLSLLFTANANTRANLHLPEEGHDYGPTKRAGAYKFLVKHLGLSLDKVLKPNRICSIDESGAVVESKEIMRIFNTEHPRPLHALRSNEAITAALALKK